MFSPHANYGTQVKNGAYLSKRLDLIAASVLLVKEANKSPLGNRLFLTASHSVGVLWRRAHERWISKTKLTQYHLCSAFGSTKMSALSSVSLLPDDDLVDHLS